MIAVRNRAAENCNAEVASADAGEGDNAFKRIGRTRSDVVARCHQNHQGPCEELHTRRTPRRLPDFAVFGGTCGEHFVQVPGRTPFERLQSKKPTEEVCAIRGEGAGETEILRTVEQNESQIPDTSLECGSE